jgi:hypothetical protein
MLEARKFVASGATRAQPLSEGALTGNNAEKIGTIASQWNFPVSIHEQGGPIQHPAPAGRAGPLC